MTPARVVVVDDQALARAGFAMILDAQPDLEVVGEAGDGAAAITLVRQTRPDVVLMDVRMPELDGIAATREITRSTSAGEGVPRVLVLTTFDLDEHVYDALQAGASGFLLKDVPREELVHAVRVVARGDALLAPTVTRRLLADFARARPEPRRTPAQLAALSARERETLALLARGLSNAEIAAELVVSEHTVKSHVGAVLTKLDLRDRIHAVILAYEVGLVRPADPS